MIHKELKVYGYNVVWIIKLLTNTTKEKKFFMVNRGVSDVESLKCFYLYQV